VTVATLELHSDAERGALVLPPPLLPSAWADRHRVLDGRTSAEPGPWRTSRTPYLREILDAWADPLCEDVTLMKASQVGGTELACNLVGWVADQDPGPLLYVVPREEDAERFARNRLRPMFEASAALRGRMPADPRESVVLEWRLDRMLLYLAGAHSPAALAAHPVRYVLLDEVDKFPAFAGREADPVALASERTKTFWNRKIFKASTPTTRRGLILREYERGDRRRYFVACPACGARQALKFPQIKWPADARDPDALLSARAAWYECERCRAPWGDGVRPALLAGGRWVPEGQDPEAPATPGGARRSFVLSSLYSPWLSWSHVAAKFLEARHDPASLLNFVNSWLAEPWEEKTESPEPEKVLVHVAGYPAGTAPAGALLLTAGVDVQKDCLYLVVRAWGYGEESWLVRASRVESFEELLVALCRTQYGRGAGKPLGLRLGCVDSGYQTDAVYEVCRRWRHLLRPVKGHDHLAGLPYRPSALDRHPRTGRPLQGFCLWHVDTTYYKDKLARHLAAAPADPGQWHLPADPSPAYVAQLCAEQKITERDRRTGRVREEWRPRAGNPDNHYLDCEVYALAAADMLRLSALRRPGEVATYREGPPTPAPPPGPEGRERRPLALPEGRRARGAWLRGES